jgi:DNA-binding NarL/FixJ family response regulator
VRAEAVALLTECGAARLVDQADAEHRHDKPVAAPVAVLRSVPSKMAERSPAPERVAAPEPKPTEEPEFAALSGREWQIAELVSRGHTNRQIARMLSLSHKTVETYLARIFTKLGVSSRAAVATLVGRGVLTGGGD